MELKPQIIAHRGFSGLYFENTLKAFEEAVNVGADYIEFDINRTRDGEIIVVHDYSIKGKYFKDMTFEEVEKISLADNCKIPSLREVMEKFSGKIKFYIEIKDRKIVDPLLKIIKDYPDDDTVIASFDHYALRKVKEKNPHIKTSALFGDVIIDPVPTLLALDANYFHPCWEERSPEPYELIDDEFVAYLNHLGFGTISWAEDRPDVIEKLIDKGFNLISTNRPDLAYKIRRQKAKSAS